MKHKTSELTGALLDAAVAECGEWKTAHEHFLTMTLDPTFKGWRIVELSNGSSVCMLEPNNPLRQDPQEFNPSEDWSLAGPIIDRERISLIAPMLGRRRQLWTAGTGATQTYDGLDLDNEQEGDTALIAAMRCFVSSKLGEEVDL